MFTNLWQCQQATTYDWSSVIKVIIRTQIIRWGSHCRIITSEQLNYMKTRAVQVSKGFNIIVQIITVTEDWLDTDRHTHARANTHTLTCRLEYIILRASFYICSSHSCIFSFKLRPNAYSSAVNQVITLFTVKISQNNGCLLLHKIIITLTLKQRNFSQWPRSFNLEQVAGSCRRKTNDIQRV